MFIKYPPPNPPPLVGRRGITKLHNRQFKEYVGLHVCATMSISSDHIELEVDIHGLLLLVYMCAVVTKGHSVVIENTFL